MTTWNASEDVEILDHSYVADGNVGWHSHSGKHVATIQPTSYTLTHLSQRYENGIHIKSVCECL